MCKETVLLWTFHVERDLQYIDRVGILFVKNITNRFFVRDVTHKHSLLPMKYYLLNFLNQWKDCKLFVVNRGNHILFNLFKTLLTHDVGLTLLFRHYLTSVDAERTSTQRRVPRLGMVFNIRTLLWIDWSFICVQYYSQQAQYRIIVRFELSLYISDVFFWKRIHIISSLPGN